VATTLKDVAERAGVSIKTVSNVVRDLPLVAPETRERVRAAIEQLHYRPNLTARHLRKARLGVLALAIADLDIPYFSEVGKAVIAAAAAEGYTVLIDYTGGTRDNERHVINGLRPHLIDGVILSPLALEMEDVQPSHVRVPIVLLGERLFGAPWDHIVIDNVSAARLATNHLIGLGRRRIGVIGLQDTSAGETARQRWRGFQEAMNAAGMPVDPALVVEAPSFHRVNGAEAMRHLLTLHPGPDAVFCFNDLLALGAMRALHQAGRRVPDDVAVVGFDDIEEGHFSTPSLTSIAPDKWEIARLAVSLLLARLRGERTGPPERFQPPYWLVVRESTVGAAANSTFGAVAPPQL